MVGFFGCERKEGEGKESTAVSRIETMEQKVRREERERETEKREVELPKRKVQEVDP